MDSGDPPDAIYYVYVDGALVFQGGGGAEFGVTTWLYCGQSYSARVEARNDCGSSTSTFTFTIQTCSESNTDADCLPPDPDFHWEPAAPEPGEAIDFHAAQETRGYTTLFSWDFGDGQPAGFGADVEHSYAAAGGYPVRLEVANQAGVETITKIVMVGGATAIEIAGPGSGRTGEILNFDVSAEGCTPAAAGWTWSLDGGTTLGASTGASVHVVWSSAGSKQVEVTNSACGSAVGRHAVTVTEATDPQIELSGPPITGVDEPVVLSASATGCTAAAAGWTWELGGGAIESGAGTSSVTASWSSEGTYEVTARNSGCGSAAGRHSLVVEVGQGPQITQVERALKGFFFEGTPVENRFDVAVEWNGIPGEVRFSIGERLVAAAPATSTGASHAFSIARDFSGAREPWEVEIVAVNGEGVEGEPVVEDVWVVPPPAWLKLARSGLDSLFDSEVVGDHVFYALAFEYPQPHLAEDGPIDIPNFVPFLGGKLGLTETFVKLEGRLSNSGKGNLALSGQTGFVVGGDEIRGGAKGDAQVEFGGTDGVVLARGVGTIWIRGVVDRERGLLELVPALEKAERLPKLGGLFKRVNRITTVTGTFRAGLDADLVLVEDEGTLAFSETRARLGLGLGAKVEVDLQRVRLKVESDVDGGGEVGLPRPLVRGLWLEGRVAASATLDLLLDIEVGGEVKFACRWPAAGDLCGEEPALQAVELLFSDLAVQAIRHDYASWGEASKVIREAPLHRDEASAWGATASRDGGFATLAENVFPGASPTILEAGGDLMVLWEHQDEDDPANRSLEISWSVRDDGGWSAAALLADDDRLDLKPVAGIDERGRVVAAWLRTRDDAPASLPANVSEAADFYRSLEVVSATFDPGSAMWSAVTSLTDDEAMDADLRLETDFRGRLLLTWLSNSGGEMVSTEASPTDVRYSFWDAEGGAWMPAGTVAGRQAGVVRHAAAVHGDAARVVIERETVDGRGRLDIYRWDGSSWSGPRGVADVGHDAWGVAARFDHDGRLHLVWVRNGEVVHLQDEWPEPRPVARGSGLGLVAPLFVGSPEGHLALIWPATGEHGTADPFVSFYDMEYGAWSHVRPLMSLEAMVREIGAFYGSDGTLRLVLTVTGISPNGGDGRSDLLRVDYRPGRDLAFGPEGLTLDPPRPQPGDPVRATFDLRNAGDLAIGGFAVELRSRQGGASERVEVSMDSGELLAGGASVPLRFDLLYPHDALDLVAVLDPADRVEEIDEANNRAAALLSNQPPVPVIEVDRISGPAPLIVTFDASGSRDPEGQPLDVRWSFGDGSAGAEGSRVQHSFRRPGVYRVAALVSDERLSRSSSVEITVESIGDRCGSEQVLCLGGGRFEVTASWRTPDGNAGSAYVRSLTEDTGYLWFFAEDNVEVVVKVLDGCPLNDHFWVFLAGLTNVEVELTVEDVVSGEIRTYASSDGTAFAPVQDTGAFAACGSL